MKVTIYNALSLDGYIAGPEHNTDWVSEADWQCLGDTLKEYGLIFMGSTTYEVSKDGGEIPYGDCTNIICTQRPEEYVSNDLVQFTDEDPVRIIENQTEHVLVIGGGKLNATLLKAGVVTDVITTIHPVILGQGTRQFVDTDYTAMTKLEKLSHEDIGDGVVKIHYKVAK